MNFEYPIRCAKCLKEKYNVRTNEIFCTDCKQEEE